MFQADVNSNSTGSEGSTTDQFEITSLNSTKSSSDSAESGYSGCSSNLSNLFGEKDTVDLSGVGEQDQELIRLLADINKMKRRCKHILDVTDQVLDKSIDREQGLDFCNVTPKNIILFFIFLVLRSWVHQVRWIGSRWKPVSGVIRKPFSFQPHDLVDSGKFQSPHDGHHKVLHKKTLNWDDLLIKIKLRWKIIFKKLTYN